MELCRKSSCMFLTNMTVFCTEWFYSTAHCLQEKSHQSHGTPGEIWGFNPGYNGGRKMFHTLKKHSFSFSFFASFFLFPVMPHLRLCLFKQRSPSPTLVQRSKTALALFRSRASHQYMWLHLWAT